MPLIDKTYFKGPLTVAQVTEPSVAADLDNYIAKYEAEFLRKLFGYELYQAYTAGVAASNALYTVLQDGTGEWEGLKQPIANYVYFHYMRAQVTATTGTGEKQVQAQNANNADAATKQCRAWNEMVHLLRPLVDYLEKNKAVYPEYKYDYYYTYTWRGWHCANELFRPINVFSI